jgi:CubicO group peptidase (beta-lactamase class C family)
MLGSRSSDMRFPHWLCVALGLAFAQGSVVAEAQTLTPDQVSAALPALDAMAKRVVDSGAVPGLAVAVVYDDEVVFLRGYGVREVGKPDAVDPDTVFQIASLSKPISSTIVAALVSDDVVSWDSRIADLDPQFRLHDAYPSAEVTVRDLFSHRSGLPGTAGDELEDIGYDRAGVLARLRLAPPASSFRAGYSYSNFGLTEGAVAAVTPTGKPWEEIAEERLYRPLGMASTSSRHADFTSRANRSALHVRIDGAWVAKVERDPDAQSPAGGVSTNVRDLAQWMRLELGDGVFAGKRLIDAAAIAQTHAPLVARGDNPVTGGASFYGLGWNVEFGRHGLVWGHAGAFSAGARTLVSLHPKAGLGVAVLSNAFPTGAPEGIADAFADLAFDGKPAKDWLTAWNGVYAGLFGPAEAAVKTAYAGAPTPASVALPYSAYVVRYANAYVGDAFVVVENGGLMLEVGPNRARSYPLRHFDRDLFLYFPDRETPDRPSALSFAIGPDGKAARMTAESLNGLGLGVLERVGY